MGVPSMPHVRVTSASEAFGDGTCEAYAGTAAHSDAEARRPLAQASCSTPTMPVGPS